MADADPFDPIDPLERAPAPERVNYATGVLLDAEDFRDEQTYHRGRLARALRHLVGFGTVAGLRITAPVADDAERELTVAAGLAVDRYGRLIELAEPQCIRLARWFAAAATGDLRAAVQRSPRVAVDVAVVADVFLSWHACGRAKTPAFASGPFDALDAVVPARLADGFALDLVPRAEGPPDPIPVPANVWPDAAADAAARLEAVLAGWQDGVRDGSDGLDPLVEHVPGRDASAVLLARVTLPVTLAADAPGGTRPQLRLDAPVTVDNALRPIIFLPGKWLGRLGT